MNKQQSTFEEIYKELIWRWNQSFGLTIQIRKTTDPTILYYLNWLDDQYHKRIMQLGEELDQLINEIK